MSKVDHLKKVVDELGVIRAQKKALETREEKLRDKIKDAHVRSALGERFEALRVEQNRTEIDWKAVAAKLKPSRQLVTAHTSVKEVVQIRTKVRRDVQLREAMGA